MIESEKRRKGMATIFMEYFIHFSPLVIGILAIAVGSYVSIVYVPTKPLAVIIAVAITMAAMFLVIKPTERQRPRTPYEPGGFTKSNTQKRG